MATILKNVLVPSIENNAQYELNLYGYPKTGFFPRLLAHY